MPKELQSEVQFEERVRPLFTWMNEAITLSYEDADEQVCRGCVFDETDPKVSLMSMYSKNDCSALIDDRMLWKRDDQLISGFEYELLWLPSLSNRLLTETES